MQIKHYYARYALRPIQAKSGIAALTRRLLCEGRRCVWVATVHTAGAVMSRSSGRLWKLRSKNWSMDEKMSDSGAKHQTSAETETLPLSCSSHVRFKKQKINCEITVQTGVRFLFWGPPNPFQSQSNSFQRT